MPYTILNDHKFRRICDQERFKSIHQDQFSLLTKRETEIINLVVLGFSNPQIADQLFISRHTVEQHRKNINRKLKVHSIPQLFQYALAFDLV
ncbi:MAG: helix-turn-helix transcriptional regulator [Reichenbachiella sp.]|uniref:response regulator transcription factor n=1 Tax=Reichenbachiella sp. TaxID=2184521 RepID=UPI0032656ECC